MLALARSLMRCSPSVIDVCRLRAFLSVCLSVLSSAVSCLAELLCMLSCVWVRWCLLMVRSGAWAVRLMVCCLPSMLPCAVRGRGIRRSVCMKWWNMVVSHSSSLKSSLSWVCVVVGLGIISLMWVWSMFCRVGKIVLSLNCPCASRVR